MCLQTCMYMLCVHACTYIYMCVYQWVCVWHLVTGTTYVAGEGILSMSVFSQLIRKSVTPQTKAFKAETFK